MDAATVGVISVVDSEMSAVDLMQLKKASSPPKSATV